jgi:uncharacterized membrane protein YbhN (UPF0104 family)
VNRESGPHLSKATIALGRVVVIALAVVAVVTCARQLYLAWPTVSQSLTRAEPTGLVIGAITTAMSMVGLALLWRRVLTALGHPRPLRDVLAWYFAGEVGKYLPGGIWPVIGRGELARGSGIHRGVAYPSVLISLGLSCIGAAASILFLAPFVATDRLWLGALGWAALALLLWCCRPGFTSRLVALVSWASKGKVTVRTPSFAEAVGLVATAMPTWFLTGVASVAITAALGYDQHPSRVAIAAIAGWLVGFLALPVPAGVGLRELTFVLLSGLDPGPAVAVAAIARLFFMAVDGVAALAALPKVRHHSQKRKVPA